MHGIGDVIRHIHDLALKAALLPAAGLADDGLDEGVVCGVKAFDQALWRVGYRGCVDAGFVFEHAVQGLVGQIQAGIVGMLVFKTGHNAQGLRVALKAAMRPHELMQRPLAVMAKGRMAQVVGQADRLDQVRVGSQRQGNALGNLSDFERVGEAGPKKISLVDAEDLGLALQTPKRSRVNNPGAVMLKLRPPVRCGPCRLRRMADRV